MNTKVNTENAPKAIGPYSQAIKASNGMLFISGQIPINPAVGSVVQGTVTEQTEQVFKNLKAILDEAGYTFNDVVKTTCLLSTMDDFAAMNAVYAKHFTDMLPARAAFAVKTLPMGVLVEIEAIAVK